MRIVQVACRANGMEPFPGHAGGASVLVTYRSGFQTEAHNRPSAPRGGPGQSYMRESLVEKQGEVGNEEERERER